MKLSVITVCRNEGSKIRATLESVRTQSYTDFEHIVVDGASTDETVEVIRQYSDRIAYWCSEPDTGIYAAMNKGIRKAKGDYLLFLNGGDSLAAPDVLERVFSLGYQEDILYGDMVKDDAGRQYLSSLDGYNTSAFFLFTHTLPHQGSFIKRRLFEELGLYDESYKLMGDYEFFKRALVKNRATARYLGFVVGIFDYSGMSTRPDFKRLQRNEARHARISTYGIPRFVWFSLLWGVYDLLVYRPLRKLKTLATKR